MDDVRMWYEQKRMWYEQKNGVRGAIVCDLLLCKPKVTFI